MRIDGEHSSLRTSIGGQARLTLALHPRTRMPSGRLDLAAGGRAWLETGDRRRILARNELRAFALATARHLRAVMTATERGEEPPASGAHARQVLAVVEAAYTSAASGTAVALS
jgi:predicted dehydrogenase